MEDESFIALAPRDLHTLPYFYYDSTHKTHVYVYIHRHTHKYTTLQTEIVRDDDAEITRNTTTTADYCLH